MTYLPDVTQDAPTVLVTGANGFVGSRICRRLLADGYHVIAGVRKTADLKLLADVDVAYRYGDITQPDTLSDMVRGIDYVVQNAGVVKAKRPETFFKVNEEGVHHLLEALVAHNPAIKRVVMISSIAAVGPSEPGTPRAEDDPPNPVTTYGRSKLAGEKVAREFAGKLPLTIIRPPGVYGPGDKEILAVFKAVNRRIKPLIGDPRRRLQLVHVDDLCDAIAKALTAGVPSGSTYFAAEKDSFTYRQMVDLLALAAGKTTFSLVLPPPLFRLIAAVSEFSCKMIGVAPMLTREKARELNASWEVTVDKARRELGFESSISFERGARETFDWYRKEGWL